MGPQLIATRYRDGQRLSDSPLTIEKDAGGQGHQAFAAHNARAWIGAPNLAQ